MKTRKEFFFFVFLLAGCGSALQNDRGYDVFALYDGVYTREGDSWTGIGFVEGTKVEEFFKGLEYRLDTRKDDGVAVPMRTGELIKRVYVVPRKQGNVLVSGHYVYFVAKPSTWK